MKKTILAAGVAALVFTACGSDSSSQDDLAKILMASAKDEGVVADEACVKEVAAKLSDDDAKKVIASEGDIDAADLSAEGYSTAAGLLNCVDVSSIAGVDAIIDEQIAQLNELGVPFDEQCIRDIFANFDFSQLSADGALPPGFQDTVLACVDIGG